MRALRSLRVISVVLSVLLVFVAGCTAPTTTAPATTQSQASQPAAKKYPDVIKFGVLLPQTGNSAFAGGIMTDGVLAAAAEINKAGGVRGSKLEPVIYDTMGDPKQAVTVYKKMVEIDKVPIGIIGWSNVIFAVGPLAEQDKVFLLNPGAPPSDVPRMGKNVWHSVPGQEWEMILGARYAYQDLGLRKMAFMYPNVEANELGVKRFAQEFERLGGKAVAFEMHQNEAVDMRPQLTKVKAASPDGLYIYSYSKDPGQIIKQAREIGFTGKIMGYGGSETPETIQVGGQAAEGYLVTARQYDPDATDPETTLFKQSFGEYIKGKYVPGYWSATTYDGMKVLAKAIGKVMEKGGDLNDPEQFKQALTEVKTFPGATGTAVFVGQVAERPFMIKEVKGKEFKIIKRF